MMCYECAKPINHPEKYATQDIRSEQGNLMRIRAHIACAEASANYWPGITQRKPKQ